MKEYADIVCTDITTSMSDSNVLVSCIVWLGHYKQHLPIAGQEGTSQHSRHQAGKVPDACIKVQHICTHSDNPVSVKPMIWGTCMGHRFPSSCARGVIPENALDHPEFPRRKLRAES